MWQEVTDYTIHQQANTMEKVWNDGEPWQENNNTEEFQKTTICQDRKEKKKRYKHSFSCKTRFFAVSRDESIMITAVWFK